MSTSQNNAESPLSVLVHGATPVHEIAHLAQQIEAAGFGSLWFGEDYFFAGGLTSAAIALQATQHIKIGLGVVATVARHPAVLAMEAATLAGAFPGRFTVGIGHGVPGWMKQMRLYPKSPLTAMRECMGAVRDLADGKTVNVEGEYFGFRDITLQQPAPDLSLLAGVVGPKSIRAAMPYCDGLIVSALAGPEYVRNAKKLIEESLAAAQRSITPQLPVFALACLGDGAKTREELRAICAFYLAAMGATDLTGSYGVNDQLKDMIARGGADIIAREMPDEWLEWLGISGTRDHARQQIQQLLDAGATSVALAFVPHESFEEQLAFASRELLPCFARG